MTVPRCALGVPKGLPGISYRLYQEVQIAKLLLEAFLLDMQK